MWRVQTFSWNPNDSKNAFVLTLFASIISASFFVGLSGSSAKDTTMNPGSIALIYTVDLFSGKPSEARDLVYSLDRQAFDVVAAVIKGNRVSAHGLSVGSSTIKGDAAVVVLEGTFCVAGPSGKVSKSKTSQVSKCFTNSNPKSSNKAAQVALIRSATGHWYVYYPRPK